MTVKERLYRWVNVLPEAELVPAERYLEYLAQSADRGASTEEVRRELGLSPADSRLPGMRAPRADVPRA